MFSQTVLSDLEYEDGVVLLSEDLSELQVPLDRLDDRLDLWDGLYPQSVQRYWRTGLALSKIVFFWDKNMMW